MKQCVFILVMAVIFGFHTTFAQQDQQWLTYEPSAEKANGKYVVLISGDEEYRSEEALPMLAKILAHHHGFKATVLFAIDPKTGKINPDYQQNIPGLEQLQAADLMVIFTRFRELPDEQMQFIDEYVRSGKPIVGLRTATHAFSYQRDINSPYAKYSYNSKADQWQGGFGRKVLGETWIDHHGDHGKEGTRGLIDGIKKREKHPVLSGVKDIWGATDVYGTRALEGDAQVLVWGQPTHGMTPESAVNIKKSIMPVAWIKHYTSKTKNTGRVFTTTMGASVDLVNADLRRLIINGCYWGLKMEEQISQNSNVEIVGDYEPTMFGFGGYKKGLSVQDFK